MKNNKIQGILINPTYVDEIGWRKTSIDIEMLSKLNKKGNKHFQHETINDTPLSQEIGIFADLAKPKDINKKC